MAKLKMKELDMFLREYAAADLTKNEKEVLMDWFQDSPDYHASTSLAAKRLGLDESVVKRSRASLKEKGVLIEDGFETLSGGASIRKFKFGKLPIREGASLLPPGGEKNDENEKKRSPKKGTNSHPIHPNKHLKTLKERLAEFPGAQEKYDTLTEAQYGGMTREEYAIQRSYADSFPRVKFDEDGNII